MLKNKTYGFVLIGSLILLIILSLFSIYNLRRNKDLFIFEKARLSQQKNWITWNNTLQKIPEYFHFSTVCRMQQPQNITNKPSKWWQNHACLISDKRFNYYFILEYLGENSCAKVRDNKRNLSDNVARHWRVNLLINCRDKLAGKNSHPGIYQLGYVQGVARSSVCQYQTFELSHGLQFIRKLNY